MATKSSIHIKPCRVTSSGAHNRRTAEYMRNIGKSQIYIVPELTAGNEQWINPSFGSPDLQAHYDYIKRMVKEKTGRAMQEKERERKGKNGKLDAHQSVREYYSSDQIQHWQMYESLVRNAKDAGESHRCKSSYTRTRDTGLADNQNPGIGRVSQSVKSGSSRIIMPISFSTG